MKIGNSERKLERFQPLFVRFPPVDTIPVDGSSHLLRAGRMNPTLKRSNLRFLPKTVVEKVLIDGDNRAFAVQVRQGNKIRTFKARREVILFLAHLHYFS